ncbi:MAG: prolipoprotein diacylglyceryl transferase [Deltaproteobacteria bacterium]|nr:prolipoprotein diacylglyceryl transferase [Deltaproteobacteria bacterium]
MWPDIFSIGPITLHSFGLMMAIAFWVASWLVQIELQRRGMNGEFAWTIMGWAVFGGLGGAKLWAIAEDPAGLLSHPITTIFSGSGWVWYGGLLGGFAAVTYAIRSAGLPWLQVVDCIAPAMAAGHAIGRIGCQLAGDGDWGSVSDVPWAMAYPNAIIGWPYPPGVRVHPTPVYEMLAYFAVFAILWRMRKRPHPDGALLWWYLVLACSARFVIEFWRVNPIVAFGLSAAQLTSLALVAFGAWRLIAGRGTAPAASERLAQAAPR